jgi:hypothetical protein
LRKAERRVAPEEKKGQERDDEEIGNRQIGNATVTDEQRNNYIHSCELGGEKK